MKRAFTMIELIFVIVFLAVLAAVAIPRLAATRDDAEIAKGASNLSILIMDLSSYYTSVGEFKSDIKWKNITNVNLLLDNSGSAIDNTTSINTDVFLSVKNKGCSKISVSDGIVTVSNIGTSNDTICVAFNEVKSVKKLTKTHKFSGSNVKFNP
ncbi:MULTISPECIES: type II secretion system protein [unclassified Campylobacter]|uniref:type II secretion system protein n=1 Tax=unclassified Campylobacter TaxID=2593542 RepID=UPI001B8CF401|nr:MULTISPECIES: type II secretion system protein [unclassified Campylobacter]QKG29569.1 putative type II secretion system protein [Campylobacter sp. RM16187]